MTTKSREASVDSVPVSDLVFQQAQLSPSFTPKGSAKTHRKTADALFLRLRKYLKKHQSNILSPKTIIAWFQALGAKQKVATCSIYCQGAAACKCERQLAASTLRQYSKELRSCLSMPPKGQEALKSYELMDYLARVQKQQDEGERPSREPAFLTTSHYENVMSTLMNLFMYYETRNVQTAFEILQTASIFAVDMKGGQRPGEITRATTARVFFSTIPPSASTPQNDLPNKMLHFGIKNRKVAGSKHHIAMVVSGNQTCPGQRLEEYTEFAAEQGIHFGNSCPLLYPAIVHTENKRTISLARDAKDQYIPVSTTLVNKYIRKAMADADMPSYVQDFRICNARNTNALLAVEESQDDQVINNKLGWAPNSQMSYRYIRQAEFAAMLPHRRVTASLVAGTEARSYDPVFP